MLNQNYDEEYYETIKSISECIYWGLLFILAERSYRELFSNLNDSSISKRYPIKLNDYPHKPKRLLFNKTKKSPPETQNKAFLSFPVGIFYCHRAEKWLFYAKKRITEIVSFQLSLFGRGRRTRTLGTRFWSNHNRCFSQF